MAKENAKETPKIQGGKGLMKGNETGKPFTSDNQPSPEAKSKGWQELRAQRLLTQKILEEMTKGTNMADYFQSLLSNAKMGNAKAIETINRGIEDQVDKSEVKVETNIEKITFK